jgi:hypothetical protein
MARELHSKRDDVTDGTRSDSQSGFLLTLSSLGAMETRVKHYNHTTNNASKEAPNDTAKEWHIQHPEESIPNEEEGEWIAEHRPHDQTNRTGWTSDDQSNHTAQQDALPG